MSQPAKLPSPLTTHRILPQFRPSLLLILDFLRLIPLPHAPHGALVRRDVVWHRRLLHGLLTQQTNVSTLHSDAHQSCMIVCSIAMLSIDPQSSHPTSTCVSWVSEKINLPKLLTCEAWDQRACVICNSFAVIVMGGQRRTLS
jgi:hypothetical protein